MIAYVEGRPTEVGVNAVVVVTESGVGYEIFVPGHTLSRLSGRDGRVALYTCMVMREDAQELFGFETWDERRTFQTLLSVSKVGARTALAVLSVYRPDGLRRLVLDGDPAPLTRVPGIGKKTAQHVFLELKDKLKLDDAPVAGASSIAGSVFRDALDGLIGLGYAEDEAAPVLRIVLRDDPELDVGGALRAALKNLAGGRR